MRKDVYVEEVLAKCEALKRSGFWVNEPKIRPRAWIGNFDETDRPIAAVLLDNFTFFSDKLTDRLLVSAFHNLGDGSNKGPNAPPLMEILRAISTAKITPVTGETPNPTDSGYLFCRKIRQLLGVPQEFVVEPIDALAHAKNGGCVIFVDDFVGSGDQFLETWTRKYPETVPLSFYDVQNNTNFTAIYISLVATQQGLASIHTRAPTVAVSVSHILKPDSTLHGVVDPIGLGVDNLRVKLVQLLKKYESRLNPQERYIAENQRWRVYGYNCLSAMLAFEHSVPDATLPIFWSKGHSPEWIPLVERT